MNAKQPTKMDVNRRTTLPMFKSPSKRSITTPSAGTAKNRIFCLLIGLLVGFFVQQAALYIDIVILEVLGDELFVQMHESKSQMILLSVASSFVTSIVVIMVLGFIRYLVVGLFLPKPTEKNTRKNKDMVGYHYLELFFVIGTLLGVTLAWAATDFFMGIMPKVDVSLITLGIVLLCCRAVAYCRSQCKEDNQAQAAAMIPDEENQYFMMPGENGEEPTPILVIA